MNSEDTRESLFYSTVACAAVASLSLGTVCGCDSRKNDRLKNETAMKSGLVQKYDKDAKKVIWTKP